MFDGTSTKISECAVFDNGHIMQFDVAQSGPDKSVYSCSCGVTLIEHEDAGTGA